jgi:anaerobic selenocysteine-containing dehydrogenase
MSGEKKHYTFCRICESLCGLEISIRNNQVLDILPDKDHVATHGFACPKGLKQHHLFGSSDRLKYPMKKVEGEWVRISWEDALHDIGEKVRQITDAYDADAVAMYVGTAAGFGVLHPVFAQGFMTGIGTKNMFSSASQDCSNKFAVAREMYGFPFTQPHPDILHTKCLIIIGANPVVSKWSFLQVPNPSRHIKDIQRRGGQVIVIDPRKTETAKISSRHIFIRPDTDVFFYLSFLHEVIRLDGIDYRIVDKHANGFDRLAKLSEDWPPRKTEAVTGIPSGVLTGLVGTYLNADGACLYSSTGVNMGSNGSLSFWLQESINAITGNLDRKGGTLVGHGVIDFPKFGVKKGILMRDDVSRIGNFRSVNDAFPGGILADEILTPGEKKIRALFVTGGNPLITMANSNRLKNAFGQLDLLVTLDILPTETAMAGTHILPCTTSLERPDLPFVFPLMLGLQTRPYIQATRAVIKPEGEQRDEASIYLDLAKASGKPVFGSRIAQLFLRFMMRINSIGRKEICKRALPQELLLNILLRITGQKSFRSLLKDKHGTRMADHKNNDFLVNRMVTQDKRINLTPPMLLKQAEKLETDFRRNLSEKHKFRLITRRAVTTHNSWTHNYEGFVSGSRNSNYVYIHPEDAMGLGLKDGDLADVSSRTATLRIPVKLDADLGKRTVALPHGWGHQASGMQVAKKTSGVNVNILAADGPENLETVSGMANLTGFVVDISKSSGPRVTDSWSGMDE